MLKQKLNVSITMVTNKNELCALCPVDSSQHFHLNKTCKKGIPYKGDTSQRGYLNGEMTMKLLCDILHEL